MVGMAGMPGIEDVQTEIKKPDFESGFFIELARPERFELPTLWFVARYSIQLSYGRLRPHILHVLSSLSRIKTIKFVF